MSINGKLATIINEHEVAFNVGTDGGVRLGDIATVSRVVDIRDPDTNTKLGEVLVPKMRFMIKIAEPLMSVGRSYESVSKYSPPEDYSFLMRRPPRVLRRVTNDLDEEDWSTVYLRRGDPVSIESPSPPPSEAAEPGEEAAPPTEDVEQRRETPDG